MVSMLKSPPADVARRRDTGIEHGAISVVDGLADHGIGQEGERLDAPVCRMQQDELQHRYRNALTLAACIMRGSLRGADCPERGLADAERRLACLASANERLIGRHSSASDVNDVCTEALRPFVERDRRPKLTGPGALLSADVGAALSLTIHELATNALKYGALSVPEGRLEICWSLDHDVRDRPGLHFAWSEKGAPAVAPPVRIGFGTRLIDAVLAPHVAGGVSRIFGPPGFTCAFTIRLMGVSVDQS
jgi:two-component sensor histidine kinase